MPEQENNFSLKSLYSPLTTIKAFFIILIIGFLVYFNGLFNNFLGDDILQIILNVPIHSILNIGYFFGGSTFGAGSFSSGIYYKPLLSTFFSIIYTIFGQNYIAFHFVQLLLHICNAFLLFLFFKHFFRKSLALVLSIIFLVHPINSESVFYIAALQEVLFFFFGIIALLLLVNIKSLKYLILIIITLLLSLFSKETGILFIIISGIFLLIYKRKYLLQFTISAVTVVAFYLLLRIHTIGLFHQAANAPISQLSFSERLFEMPRIMSFYLQTFFFPVNLSSSYEWVNKSITINSFYFPLIMDVLFISSIVFIASILYKKMRNKFVTYIFFCSWFFLGLLLHMQFLPLDDTISERWFYFPIVGLLGIGGILIEIYFHTKFTKKLLTVTSIVLIVLLSSRTIVRSFDWRSEESLDFHDVQVSTNDYNLENGVSAVLLNKGQLQEAKKHAEKSVSLYPYTMNNYTLGLIYLHSGQYENARKAYLDSLKHGDFYLTYEDLAGLTLLTGTTDKNLDFLYKASAKLPYDSKIWLPIAILELKRNNRDAAKYAVSQAYLYDKSENTGYFYEKIMNNEPINVKISTN